ncbi:uncharacterized protein IWZ02DRAFT_438253 [Phyllosticta citriasiana]|uniref:uncharacterized protein n=1 Tax=Phyllosticta citriasiana TaxID=595635 RepID=UPI0030FD863A
METPREKERCSAGSERLAYHLAPTRYLHTLPRYHTVCLADWPASQLCHPWDGEGQAGNRRVRAAEASKQACRAAGQAVCPARADYACRPALDGRAVFLLVERSRQAISLLFHPSLSFLLPPVFACRLTVLGLSSPEAPRAVHVEGEGECRHVRWTNVDIRPRAAQTPNPSTPPPTRSSSPPSARLRRTTQRKKEPTTRVASAPGSAKGATQ